MTITFPNKTAKEIVTECNNKRGSGKLLYNTDWYEVVSEARQGRGDPLNLELSPKEIKAWIHSFEKSINQHKTERVELDNSIEVEEKRLSALKTLYDPTQ